MRLPAPLHPSPPRAPAAPYHPPPLALTSSSGPAPQVNNDDAKAFYQKFGFSVGEVMKDYYKHQQRGATPGPASPRHRPMHPPGGSMGLGLLPRIPEHRHGISEARRGLSSSPQACAQAHDPLHFPPHRRIEPPDAVVLSKKLK